MTLRRPDGRGPGGADRPVAAAPTDAAIRAALTDLALRRGAGRSFCPSEAARALAPDWRALMPAIRRVAAAMQAEGAIRATQRGAPVDPLAARGPIRLGLP